MNQAADTAVLLPERDAEGYYIGSVPDLKGCHTQAKSLDTLMKRIREAIELCLEVEAEEAAPSPEVKEEANDAD